MTDTDKKNYNSLENTLQKIITHCISLNNIAKKRNSIVLLKIANTIISSMKDVSALFGKLFQEIFSGGSYYDGLKVGKPDEYDLDVKLVLPKDFKVRLEPIEETPGFVSIKVESPSSLPKELFINEYLSTEYCKKWIESVITKAMASFEKCGSHHMIKIEEEEFSIKMVKGGPAFTFKVRSLISDLKFDVDLVPCFVFNETHWPKGNFRKNPIKDKTSFFVVPKAPKSECNDTTIAWRLSFQKQERELMKNLRTFKPCIKLLKKLRDKQNHAGVSSYFIKTVFLWELEKRGADFWENNSLSFVFMEMLRTYADYLTRKEIFYYWNIKNNLLENTPPITVENWAKRMQKIINDIDRCLPNDIEKVCSYFLNPAELLKFKTNGTEIVPSLPLVTSEVVIEEKGSKIRANIGNVNINTGVSDEMYEMLKDLKQEIADLRKTQEHNKQEMVCLLQEIVKKLNGTDGNGSHQTIEPLPQ